MSVEPATSPAESNPDAPAGSGAAAAPSPWGSWFDEAPWVAWLGSAAIHASVLIVVSLLVIGAPAERLLWLTSGDDAGPPLEEMNLEELAVDDIPVPGETGAASLGAVTAGDEIELPGPISGAVGNVVTGETNAGELTAPPSTAEPSVDPLATVGELAGGDFSAEFSALSNPLSTRGGGLEGRRFENRLEAALAAGGTRESERAVELGLAWLAEHQFPDGGWRFDLEQHPRCAGYCGDSGHYASTTAATGLALLSFLGAGYTHQEGKYADVVSRGLYYLNEHLEITPHGGDLRDTGAPANRELDRGFAGGFNMLRTRSDTMYSHGIATIALTEAYAMTRDSALREPAEQAVQFIINAQYDDGGWRYSPGFESQSRGDMTVTGWQLTALKSGLLAGIPVPYDVWNRASEFIDGLEQDRGARYAYVAGNRATAATTAIGVLCRMICGAPRDARSLQRGVVRVGDQSPADNNVYFIYYASQVLHHMGGSRWEKWNPRMREYLIDSQSNEGHETGSWYFEESHSSSGGRLYTTAMAIMTLEVYYRYMPLYGESFVGQTP